jgi:hypothetical protein
MAVLFQKKSAESSVRSMSVLAFRAVEEFVGFQDIVEGTWAPDALERHGSEPQVR